MQQLLGHFLFGYDLVVESFSFKLQQADFEHVVNAQQYLREIERFADEILRPGL